MARSFREWLNSMLSLVNLHRDRRQGAIIYDTLAPVAAALSQQDINVEIFQIQSYLMTMTGQNLDNWAANFMLFRYPSTYSIRIAEFTDNNDMPFNPPIGSRFSTTDIGRNINFIVKGRYGDGLSLLQCETIGTVGNEYTGQLLPLQIINNIKIATMIGIYQPAQNTESDDDFRERIIEWLRQKPFAGNLSAYKDWIMGIDGVGAVKTFPVWNGGGTVKISVLDGDLNPVTPEFLNMVQTIVDPIYNQGEGLGTAPIGHTVTTATPEIMPINITATVIPRSGFVLGQLEPGINEALQNYIEEIRKEWGKGDATTPLWIFIARISMAILTVTGVYNVHSITINESTVDYMIEQTKYTQYIPKFNSVVIS